MYIAICDDENESVNRVEGFVRKFQQMHHDVKWEIFNSAEEFTGFYKNNPNAFNVLITDIEMKETSGLELANAVRKTDSGIIIFFMTSHTEYAIQCFEPEPLNFWVKPKKEDTVLYDLERAYSRISRERRYITITEKRASVRIKLDDVIYFEKIDRKTKIYTKNDEHIADETLASLARRLPEDTFVRIYQSYIVNAEYIKVLRGGEVELYDSGIKLPVGRSYADNLKRVFIRQKERSAFE